MLNNRPSDRRPRNLESPHKNMRDWKLYCWPIAGVILAIFVSIVTLDRYAPAFAIESKMPGDIRAFFQCMSFFGHGTGCLVAASLVWSLDRKNRIAIPLLVGSTLLAGSVSGILKILVHRPRPFVDSTTVADGVSLSEAVFHNFLQSFPSGHTATAFALAMGLSFLYSKGKPLFFFFAFLVGLQRIISQNHFPSDVIAGALVGVVSAQAMLLVLHRPSSVTKTAPKSIKANAPQTVDSQTSGRRNSVGGISPV